MLYQELETLKDYQKNHLIKVVITQLDLKEQIIFPEIDYDKIDKVRGMDISIVTSTNNKTHAFELLKGFNLPFKN